MLNYVSYLVIDLSFFFKFAAKNRASPDSS